MEESMNRLRVLRWSFALVGTVALAAPSVRSEPPAAPAAPVQAGNAPATQPSDEQKLADASVPADASASELSEQLRDAYLTEKQLHLGMNDGNGAYIAWGQGPVTVATEDAAFPAARQ